MLVVIRIDLGGFGIIWAGNGLEGREWGRGFSSDDFLVSWER